MSAQIRTEATFKFIPRMKDLALSLAVPFGASEYALPFFEHKGFIKVRRNEFEKRGVPMYNYTMEKLVQHQSSMSLGRIPAVNYR